VIVSSWVTNESTLSVAVSAKTYRLPAATLAGARLEYVSPNTAVLLLSKELKFPEVLSSAEYTIQRDPVPLATNAEEPELLSKSSPAAITITLLLPVVVIVSPDSIVTSEVDASAGANR
jgi:hypothetical protein